MTEYKRLQTNTGNWEEEMKELLEKGQANRLVWCNHVKIGDHVVFWSLKILTCSEGMSSAGQLVSELLHFGGLFCFNFAAFLGFSSRDNVCRKSTGTILATLPSLVWALIRELTGFSLAIPFM